jgi:Spy/CpxP family protein refolding chaperone
MRYLIRLALIALSLGTATPVVAQNRAPEGRAQMLRNRVDELFMERTKSTLGLTDEQFDRMAPVIRANGERRRALEDEERELRAALARELRPGVAARADSVNRYIEAITQNLVAYAQSFHDEMVQLAPILTPAQRGQYLQLRDQLLMRVRELQQSRQSAPPIGGGGRRP